MQSRPLTRSARRVLPALFAIALTAAAGCAAGHASDPNPAHAKTNAAGAGAGARVAKYGSAPASGTRVCGQPILRSPYQYSGAATAFRSGQYGLPTYGSPGSTYPAATRGVIIQAGHNTAAASGASYGRNHAIFYFEPGEHIIQSSMYTGVGSVYLGGYSKSAGPAIIDGVNGGTVSGKGSSYLSSSSSGVVNANQTWEYLTIKNFGASENNAVLGNENGGEFDSGNTYKYDTIGPNEYGYNGSDTRPANGKDSGGGYAIGLSGNTTIEYSCLTRNAQGAFNGTGPDDVISHNEISWNALGEYPDAGGDNPKGCGCSGGGKLFFTVNAVVTDNYVHDNYNTGIWFDFDNTGADISGNYVASNWGNGIMYEASYNARIADNTLVGNGWASDGAWPSGGRYYCYSHVSCTNGEGPVTGAGGGFPYAAMYLPNSGGNSDLTTITLPNCRHACAVTSRYSGELLVEGNNFANNFGEVMVYTDTDRFPGNIDGDSACSVPLGALDQPNSKTYYLQTKVLLTGADASIAGTRVTTTGGTKTLCDNYGNGHTSGSIGGTTQAPSTGMAVFNLDTGKFVGTIAQVTSPHSFALSAQAPSAKGARLIVSAYGGCGPADYYRAGLAQQTGHPAAAYWNNCIWGSRNVTVAHNHFAMNSASITGCTAKNMCGYTGLLAFDAGVPPLMGYFHSYPSLVARASGGLGNVWADNTYTWTGSGGLGTWNFWVASQGTQVSRAQWQSAPYGQDAGSTFDGG
jgi:parallel beta-helix repeat protein